MKVKQAKIFPAAEVFVLEKRVNEFLVKGEASEIYDIKFVCVSAEPSGKYQYSCLIIYQAEVRDQTKQAKFHSFFNTNFDVGVRLVRTVGLRDNNNRPASKRAITNTN